MTIHEFLSRFPKVQKSGDQHLVLCPAHADKNPSLAVREGPDGQILLKDHAGCTTEAILSAMNLEMAALFPEKEQAPKRNVVAEYSYQDEAGTLLFQAVRYNPKGFSQRRPDGRGNWIYNLNGVRRVVYRLPELLGQKAILYVEGEKDADAAWKLGIPATCNSAGAGKWDPSYAGQIKNQGVIRVAVIPDNDPVGRLHALAVGAGLEQVGLDVMIVDLPGLENHGDLSDFLATGKGKADVLALVKAAPKGVEAYRATVAPAPTQAPRVFLSTGEQRYSLAIHPEGIQFDVHRLRRSSQELHGELSVRVNGEFPDAKTYADGVLQVGDLNFSSTQARTTRAKLLQERSGNKSTDWHGFLEEFATSVITAERRGKPSEILADVELDDDEDSDTWTIEGFPILKSLPQILFGDAASGKSYFAMWLMGKLAHQGIPVLYVDWEFSKSEHKKRSKRLFQPEPRNLRYIRCETPLRQAVDHILEEIHTHKIQLILCDSIGFAVEGAAETQEAAAGYFRSLRQLGIGSLNIAHIPKQYDDNREAQVFGSTFFKAGARSVWFIETAKENPQGELRFGLYHRKSNVGALLQPKGFKLMFRGERTLIEAIDLKDIDELAHGFPLLDRVKALLTEPMTLKQISDDLNAPVPKIKDVLNRYKSQFVRVGSKISLTGPHAAADPNDSSLEF